MLKTFSHITLSLVLLISTMGMVVSKHYCGNEVVSVSINHASNSCCDMGNCCSTETHTYQVKDDFSSPVITTIPLLAELDILGHDLFETEGLTEPESENPASFIANSPPPKTIQTVLSLKQVYLI